MSADRSWMLDGPTRARAFAAMIHDLRVEERTMRELPVFEGSFERYLEAAYLEHKAVDDYAAYLIEQDVRYDCESPADKSASHLFCRLTWDHWLERERGIVSERRLSDHDVDRVMRQVAGAAAAKTRPKLTLIKGPPPSTRQTDCDPRALQLVHFYLVRRGLRKPRNTPKLTVVGKAVETLPA